MKLPPQITWLQYALANAAIVILIPFLALQGMPPIDWAWSWAIRPAQVTDSEPSEEEGASTQDRRSADESTPPEEEEPLPVPTPVANWLAEKLSPIADGTGVSTAAWKMFAPEPDATNHRLRATIEYRDGTIVPWRSPDWPQLSCWQRFWTSRELEYIDKISYNAPSDHWFAYADFLATQNRKDPRPDGAPKRVTFVVEEAVIENPNLGGWQPMSQFIPRSNERVVSPKRVYPVPPELLKKQRATPVEQTIP